MEKQNEKKNTTSIYKLHLGHCPIQEDCIKHKLFQNGKKIKKKLYKLNITTNHTYLQFAFMKSICWRRWTIEENELTRKKKNKINIWYWNNFTTLVDSAKIMFGFRISSFIYRCKLKKNIDWFFVVSADYYPPEFFIYNLFYCACMFEIPVSCHKRKIKYGKLTHMHDNLIVLGKILIKSLHP